MKRNLALLTLLLTLTSSLVAFRLPTKDEIKKKYSKKTITKAAPPVDMQVHNLAKKLKKETNPVEKRKLRRQLRKLGHKGGTR